MSVSAAVRFHGRLAHRSHSIGAAPLSGHKGSAAIAVAVDGPPSAVGSSWRGQYDALWPAASATRGEHGAPVI